jgi:hypothetical protein
LAALKKLLFTNESILKGEDNDDLLKDEDNLDGLDDSGAGKASTEKEMEKLRDERLKAEQDEIDKLNDWNDRQDAKFESNMEDANEKAMRNIVEKNDTVLQQQIQSAQDRGTSLQHLLKKQGASGDEVNGIMDQLKDKVQQVENMMRADENRQHELL